MQTLSLSLWEAGIFPSLSYWFSSTFKLNDAYAISAAAVTKICVFCCAPSHLTEVYKADSSISVPLTPRHQDTHLRQKWTIML